MKEIILSVIMIFGLGGFKSMRPDVISDFIIKNYNLRMRIINENPSLISQKANVSYLKKLDEYSFNIAWRKGGSYNLGFWGLFSTYILKLDVVFLSD